MCISVVLAILASIILASRHRDKLIIKIATTALSKSDDATPLDRHWTDIQRGQSRGNALSLIQSNMAAFAARVNSARAAGRSLDLMYYMWNADLTGQLMMREVIAAADRGVRVRLLLDDLGVSISDRAFQAIDSHPNIELRLFNPTKARENVFRRGLEMVLRFRSVNRRMHNKAWIADGRILIVGGRNIGDAYFDAAEQANFRDFDVIARGDCISDAEEIFDDYWNSAVSVPVRSLLARRPSKLAKLRRKMDMLASGAAARPYLAKVESQHHSGSFLMSDSLHWVDNAKVVADPPEKAAGKRRSGHNFLMETLLPVMEDTAQQLNITSPYFIPGQKGVETFSRLFASGASVCILTNSLAATDVAAVHAGYSRYRRPLLINGIKIHELRSLADQNKSFSLRGSGQASLHTKAFTRDSEIGFIGSLNFDPRSMSLNTEMGMLFSSPELVEEMDVIFKEETSRQMSFELTLNERRNVTWTGMVKGVPKRYRREPYASFSRRLLVGVMGLLPLESQL
ncbi:phospholipase D family protein [Rhizobium skierniewicense]|uniref:phospholipase D family protein n=1 Tax=Rhizobium skierniewicense TaxID=984260 RepID=UPI001FAD836E|nr:phospholipase D family protein [Rhizobium skierniewicense]MCI9865652.1 phospholipase D family protein [Rhizobium skierniewicense]